MTLYSATQIPHILKIMTALTLGLPEHHVRVVAPKVGGAFGSKLNVYAEELLCVALARKHGVPVRWNEAAPRTPSPPSRAGQIQDIELAADENGRLTAVRVRLLCDMGAYLQLVTPGIPLLGAFLYAGVYDLPAAYDFSCTSVFTNMTPTDAYRGAGRPEATYAIERAMDAGGQDGAGPDGAAAAQLRQVRAVPLHRLQRTGLRLGRPPGRSRQGGRAGRLRRGPGPPADAERAHLDQASRHRHLELLRDVRAGAVPCWRRSTTAPAAGRRPPSGCC